MCDFYTETVWTKKEICDIIAKNLPNLSDKAIKELYLKIYNTSFNTLKIKDEKFILREYKPIAPGESEHITVGIYYELPNGKIAYIYGCHGVTRKVSCCFEEGDPFLATFKEIKQWKKRDDLKDWPNAKDPKLPYVFDLYWDIKRESELVRVLKEGHSDMSDILSTIKKHDLDNLLP
jgi:hypothetical protein